MTSALGFKSKWIPSLVCFLIMCIGLLKFISGATAADFSPASMAAESFSSTYLHTYLQAFVGPGSRIKRAAVSQHVTGQARYCMSYADSTKIRIKI